MNHCQNTEQSLGSCSSLQHTGVLPNGELKTLPGNKKLQQVIRKKKKMSQNGFLESRWLKMLNQQKKKKSFPLKTQTDSWWQRASLLPVILCDGDRKLCAWGSGYTVSARCLVDWVVLCLLCQPCSLLCPSHCWGACISPEAEASYLSRPC